MKINFFVILLLFSGTIIPWGEEGHKLIANKAVDLLKGKIDNIEQYKDYITEHSIDPDLRRNYDQSEFPKHFIDIDFYDEFHNGKMIQDKYQLIKLYGDSVVTQMGILPWVTLDTFESLVRAFKEMNRDKVLIYASDLAHYVADAHQPMHTILNYDGQLSNQKGIHRRYESIMLEKYLDNLTNELTTFSETIYIEEPLDYIFGYITNSNSLSEVLFAADNFAQKAAGSTESDDYYYLLWFRTNYITRIQFESAISSLASLIFTAWIDAGKPQIEKIK